MGDSTTSPTDSENLYDQTNADLATFLQGLLIVTSTLLTGFYAVNKFRGRCNNEVIYVAVVTLLIYASNLLAGTSLTWVALENGTWVPLGRYFAWLLTCPVIIMQLIKLHSSVGYKMATSNENMLVVLDQIMIVSGAFGAVSIGAQKWIFFLLACVAGGGLFFQIYLITKENIRNFPEEAKFIIKVATATFCLSWITYPIFWIIGSPGLNFVGMNIDIVCHCVADLVSKNGFGLLAWNVRWNYLQGERDSNGRLIVRTNKKLIAKGLSMAGIQQHGTTNLGLTDDDVFEAQERPFTILLLDTDILVHKAMTMMMQRVDVGLKVAYSVDHAKAIMATEACGTFDAVVVVPKNHESDNIETLREFSKYICSEPYKIPMLGMYFDLDCRNEEPGYYIHGIIPRPLDEVAFKGTLLEWRITTTMWRRVAESVEAMEGANNNVSRILSGQPNARDVVDRGQATLDRKTGAFFANQLLPQLSNVREDQSPQNDTTSVISENNSPISLLPALNSPLARHARGTSFDDRS